MLFHKKVQEFLDEVNEQICYRPMRAAIDEELAAHIEDKAELYKEYGVEEEEAISRAVRDMGDATEIGIQMNAAHHLRICWPLLGMALFFAALGVLGNLRGSWNGIPDSWFFSDWLIGSLYFPVGVLVLLLVMCYGYPFVIRHVKKICVCYLVFCVLMVLLSLGRGLIFGSEGEAALYLISPARFMNITVWFGFLILAAPVLAVFAFRQRHKGVRGVILTGGFAAVLLVIPCGMVRGDYLYMAVLALLLTFLAVMLHMSFQEYLDLPRKKAVLFSTAVFLILVSVWGFSVRDSFGQTMELFLTPERQADSTWEDGYNGVLIRELLRRADLVGEIEISQEELYAYATGEWYFGEDGPGIWQREMFSLEENTAYLSQFFDRETVTLEDALPQHYHNNYRIAYWILKYGWLPGLLLIGAILVFCVLLVRTSFHIRNRLGRLVAFSGSICLMLQYLFYLLGNFGHQFAWFGNLPFLSEGWISILVNAVLLGLVLSAYRFDLVLEEALES